MALRERNSALHWASTRPEDNTPPTAVAVGHFVQVGIPLGIFRVARDPPRISRWRFGVVGKSLATDCG
jgi:hypothetical protein